MIDFACHWVIMKSLKITGDKTIGFQSTPSIFLVYFFESALGNTFMLTKSC